MLSTFQNKELNYQIYINKLLGVLKKTKVEPLVLNFLINILTGRIKERFNKNITTDKFIRLKNLKYKGKSVRS